MNVEKEIKQIDQAINELVYPKTQLQKAYNYYHGIRDADQFKHIEENYGIGVPTSITFNPLVRPHIDRLVGEYISLNPELKITCKDQDTVSNIMRDKQLKISKALFDYLKKYIENDIIGSILNNKNSEVDPFIEDKLNKIGENIVESYESEYEIACQNILKYCEQSKYIDWENKLQQIITDLCVSGTGYYRAIPTCNEDNIKLEVLSPINTFVEKNPNSNYLCDSYRSVVRKFMSIEDIFSEYYPYLKPEHLKILKESKETASSNDGPYYYIQATSNETVNAWNTNHTGILGGLETHPLWPGETSRSNKYVYPKLWEVFDVEWIELDYKTGKQTRHEGTKIGPEIYITKGESKYQIRSKDNPNKTRLSVNGLFFLDKNGDPNSMIIKTMDLQDKYDLLCFYRDNLIANSGTKGDFIDLTTLPTFLGEDTPERLQKWIAYKKQGIALLDTSQDGIQTSNLNTIYNGFDDTIRAESIQAISIAMQSIQAQVSMVTGVLPEALAQYEQRDAVSNVQLGVKTSMLLTKQLFKAMDTIYKETAYDMINLAKLVWPNGLTGEIVLGNYSKLFHALPEYYTMTDFDVHVEDSTKSYQNVQSLIAISGELIKSGAADLSDITNIITADSITELKRNIDKSVERKKEESNIISQLQQQVQQYEQAHKDWQKSSEEYQNRIKDLERRLEKNNESKLQLESQRIANEKERIENDKSYNDKMVDLKKQQVEAQVAEMYDGNPYNNKVKTVI